MENSSIIFVCTPHKANSTLQMPRFHPRKNPLHQLYSLGGNPRKRASTRTFHGH